MQVAFAAALAGGFGLLVAGPGWAVAARVAAEGGALIFCLRGVRFVAPAAVLAAALLAVSGHAQGAGAQFGDALHVLSAGMWAGGILALASLRPPDGWRGNDARELLARFGRIALIAFGVTALTGLLRATEQLHDLSDLWTTSYGVVLALKVVGVFVMLGISLLWRRGRPAAGLEAGVAVLVVGATALLAAFPQQA